MTAKTKIMIAVTTFITLVFLIFIVYESSVEAANEVMEEVSREFIKEFAKEANLDEEAMQEATARGIREDLTTEQTHAIYLENKHKKGPLYKKLSAELKQAGNPEEAKLVMAVTQPYLWTSLETWGPISIDIPKYYAIPAEDPKPKWDYDLPRPKSSYWGTDSTFVVILVLVNNQSDQVVEIYFNGTNDSEAYDNGQHMRTGFMLGDHYLGAITDDITPLVPTRVCIGDESYTRITEGLHMLQIIGDSQVHLEPNQEGAVLLTYVLPNDIWGQSPKIYIPNFAVDKDYIFGQRIQLD